MKGFCRIFPRTLLSCFFCPLFLEALTVSTCRLIHSSWFTTCTFILRPRRAFVDHSLFNVMCCSPNGPSCILNSDGNDGVCCCFVSEVFGFILSIVFIFWLVRSTSKVPSLHLLRPACTAPSPLCFKKVNLGVCVLEKRNVKNVFWPC